VLCAGGTATATAGAVAAIGVGVNPPNPDNPPNPPIPAALVVFPLGIGEIPPSPIPPKPKLAIPNEVCGVGAGLAGPPNIDTRSSSGLVDVPARRLAAAGVRERASVAARPEGTPFSAGTSSKSLPCAGKEIKVD
jgi:hypothetical protein